MSEFLKQRHEALGVALSRASVAQYTAHHLRLDSAANGRGASRGATFAKAARVRRQRAEGFRAGELFSRMFTAAPFRVVRLTRISPRLLDSDNLEGALKAVRDGVADGLGINDRDPRVRYVVDQEQGLPGEFSVRCELFAAPASRPEIPESSPAVNTAEGLHQRHTDECIEHLTDPGATCVCRPPAVAEPLVGVPTPNVVRAKR